jgi:hypothetical protein
LTFPAGVNVYSHGGSNVLAGNLDLATAIRCRIRGANTGDATAVTALAA